MKPSWASACFEVGFFLLVIAPTVHPIALRFLRVPLNKARVRAIGGMP
jgi:hypothetical protein